MSPIETRISTGQLADEIRRVHERDRAGAGDLIEGYLRERLKKIPEEGRLEVVSELQKLFRKTPPAPAKPSCPELDPELLSRVFSLILGRSVSQYDCAPGELLDRLAESMNVVFDSLNELIALINLMLHGESGELKTIRCLIGSDLRERQNTKPLKSYLDQIRSAFLVASQASREAHRNEMQKILQELDPDRSDKAAEEGLFAFMKKGAQVESFRERHQKCAAWLESERSTEDFSREFERCCRSLFTKKGGKGEELP